jgi:glycoprotein endo-alpha-1,2-mannosidase
METLIKRLFMTPKTAAMNHIILISFVMLLSMAAMSSAATTITWSNDGNDGNWNNTANWTGGMLPNTTSDYAKILMAAGPVFSADRTSAAYRVYLDGANGSMTMDGGTLNLNGSWIGMGYTAATDSGTLTVNNGIINTTGVSGHLYCGVKGTATFNMNGGAVNLSGTFYVGRDTGSTGTANLSGGTISCNALSMRFSGGVGTINITAGTLIIANSGAANLNTYITNGWITAYNGTGTVVVDINNINPDKTTVSASAPTKAELPSPADNETNVSVLADLSWVAPPGATSHDVYFGTSNPPAFVCNQSETAFEPGTLDFGTVYYWRIDEVSGSGTVTGSVWTFSTVSEVAENPNPVSGETNVVSHKVLRWSPGCGAVSHDVYLGTDAAGVAAAERPVGDLDGNGTVDCKDFMILTTCWLQDPAGSEPYAGVNGDNIVDFDDYAILAQNWGCLPGPDSLFKGNTTDARYDDPCDFAINTTYYWRVDEISGPKKVKGSVWSFTITPYSESLIGTVMCGYQGWFNCPSDGTTRGWVHWGSGDFSPDNCTVDMWPDMTDYGAGEKFLASGFYDGTNYYVFSSHNLATVRRHFQWMRDYGIDGVYLQRFANEVRKQTSTSFYHRNDVLDYCKDAANMYGRKYAVMYDLSGLGGGRMQSVKDDWKYLVDTKQVTRDPADHAYMHHRGKPVVAVWGIGFNDGRSYTLAECFDLVNFLRNDPVYGGNIVMVGVPSYWRTLDHDCLPDPNVHTIIRTADIVSPWSVGRYSAAAGVTVYADTVWTPDVNWCQTNSTPSHPIEYLPVIWPGYSFHNAQPATKPFNEIPRNGGQFFWDQVKAAVDTSGAEMIYVAMFDEVDEGTAIFKVSNNPPRPGGVDMFVTYNMDGYNLPSDEYLWLTGQARKALRSEMNLVPSTRPVRP